MTTEARTTSAMTQIRLGRDRAGEVAGRSRGFQAALYAVPGRTRVALRAGRVLESCLCVLVLTLLSIAQIP